MTFDDRQLTSMTFEAPPPSQTLNRSTNVLDYGRVGFNQWRIQRGGAGEVGSPRYFWTKLRPAGPKKFFFKTAPTPLISGSGWPPPPPPIWRSGSVTVNAGYRGLESEMHDFPGIPWSVHRLDVKALSINKCRCTNPEKNIFHSLPVPW